jgi:hypothetical protein
VFVLLGIEKNTLQRRVTLLKILGQADGLKELL